MTIPRHLLLVGGHKLLRESLAHVLEGLEYTLTAIPEDNESDLINALDKIRPDAVIFDVNLGSVQLCQCLSALQSRHPNLPMVLLGPAEPNDNILHLLEQEPRAYIDKNAPVSQLTQALETVFKGQSFCSPHIAHIVFSRLAHVARENRRAEQMESFVLTHREMEVLSLIAHGLDNRSIARKLCLSLYTVKNHVHHILEKMGVRHRREAAVKAYQKQWLGERRFSEGAEGPSSRKPIP